MIKWIKGYIFLLRMYRKNKKLESNIYNAKKHALISLSYWKDCMQESDLNFQIENSSIFVRLGKGNECQADEKINSEFLHAFECDCLECTEKWKKLNRVLNEND